MKKILSSALLLALALALALSAAGCRKTGNKGDTSKSGNAVENLADNPFGIADADADFIEVMNNSGEVSCYTYSQELSDYDKEFCEFFAKYYGGSMNYKYIAYADNQTQYLIDHAAGEAPSYIGIDYRKWPKVGNRQIVYSMDELKDMNIVGLDHPELVKYDKIASNYTIDGKRYAFSVSYATPVMIAVNLDLFDQYSVKAPTEYFKEGTWGYDTFVECCKNISRTTSDGTKIYGYNGWNFFWFLTANDDELIVWDKEWKLQSNISNTRVKSTLGNIKSLYDNGYYGGAEKDFVGGKIAMSAATADNLKNSLKDATFKWDIVPFPYGNDNSSGQVPGEVTVIGIVNQKGNNVQGVVNYNIARRVFDNNRFGVTDSGTYIGGYKDVFSENQIKLIQSYVNQIGEDLFLGVGNLKTTANQITNELKGGNMTVQEIVQTYEPVIKGQCVAEMENTAE